MEAQKLQSEDYLLKYRLPAFTEGIVACVLRFQPEAPWSLVKNLVAEAGPVLKENPKSVILDILYSIAETEEPPTSEGETEEEGVEGVDLSDDAKQYYLDSHNIYVVLKDALKYLAELQPEAPFEELLVYLTRVTAPPEEEEAS